MNEQLVKAQQDKIQYLTDRLAALEAEKAKLREALEKLLMVIGNFTGNEILCDTVTEKQIIADARALQEGKE